jgi:acyl-CoA thioester hydrolase
MAYSYSLYVFSRYPRLVIETSISFVCMCVFLFFVIPHPSVFICIFEFLHVTRSPKYSSVQPSSTRTSASVASCIISNSNASCAVHRDVNSSQPESISAMSLKQRTRSHYRYFELHRLRWSDNDQYGHVNNSIYAFLIDSIVNSYLISSCSLRPTDSSSPHIGLVVASKCQYFASLEFPEEVELGLAVRKMGSSSVEYEVGFFRKGRDEVSAVGGFTHVFVEREGRRPVKELREELKEGLGKVLVPLGEEKARL